MRSTIAEPWYEIIAEAAIAIILNCSLSRNLLGRCVSDMDSQAILTLTTDHRTTKSLILSLSASRQISQDRCSPSGLRAYFIVLVESSVKMFFRKLSIRLRIRETCQDGGPKLNMLRPEPKLV